MKTICVALLTALLITTASGCGCFTDAQKKNTTGCIVLHDLIDCTTAAVKDSVPYFAQIIGGLISGGTPADQIPWDDIEKQAAAMGIKDGACLLAELKNLLFSAPTASPESMSKRKLLSDSLEKYKQKHFNNRNVKIKIIDRRTGKIIEV